MTNSPAADQPDRRHYHHVREIFEEAYILIEPFFAPENQWGGRSLSHWAYRVLRDHYPELSSEECFVLVGAAQRIWAERKHGQPRNAD